MRKAVIGIGSISVRLLIADCGVTEYTPVLRDRCGTRLFAGLREGQLSRESMQIACTAVRDMAEQARAHGAQEIRLFATSATRDAGNQADFAALLQDQAGLALEVCTGAEEAWLSYRGAALPGLCGMVDIGGGSTEWTVGRDDTLLASISLQMGAERLRHQLSIDNPADLPRAEAAAAEVLQAGLATIRQIERPPRWVGVGGTFTTLAAMDRQLASFDRSLVHGHTLTRDCAERWAHRLAALTVEERRALPGLQPQRAEIVVHGLAILLACMRLLALDVLTVSDSGNLDGFIREKMLVPEIG